MNDHDRRVAEVFELALGQPPSEWESFVRQQCQGEPLVVDEVLSLLRQNADDSFLNIDTVSSVLRLPDYIVSTEIGHGGMGTVWKGLQISLNRAVAIKVLHDTIAQDESIHRFQREAGILAKLQHPHIVQVIDNGTSESGDRYFVMEYVTGPDGLPLSLNEVLKSGPLPEAKVLRFSTQITSAITHAHSQGVIHRDIKPANILITATEDIKVADFSVARVKTGVEPALTGRFDVLGTRGYMPNEQLTGSALVDERCDVYSLGVVVYEMLTAMRPAAEFVPPSQVNREIGNGWDSIVSKAITKSPSGRFRSMLEFQQAILSIDSPKNHGASERRHNRLGKIAKESTLGLVSLAVCVGVCWWMTPSVVDSFQVAWIAMLIAVPVVVLYGRIATLIAERVVIPLSLVPGRSVLLMWRFISTIKKESSSQELYVGVRPALPADILSSLASPFGRRWNAALAYLSCRVGSEGRQRIGALRKQTSKYVSIIATIFFLAGSILISYMCAGLYETVVFNEVFEQESNRQTSAQDRLRNTMELRAGVEQELMDLRQEFAAWVNNIKRAKVDIDRVVEKTASLRSDELVWQHRTDQARKNLERNRIISKELDSLIADMRRRLKDRTDGDEIVLLRDYLKIKMLVRQSQQLTDETNSASDITKRDVQGANQRLGRQEKKLSRANDAIDSQGRGEQLVRSIETKGSELMSLIDSIGAELAEIQSIVERLEPYVSLHYERMSTGSILFPSLSCCLLVSTPILVLISRSQLQVATGELLSHVCRMMTDSVASEELSSESEV